MPITRHAKSTTTPSFAGLRPASEASSRTKRNNRNVDTLHEVALRSELWRMGLRFRKNVRSLPGKPDIVFSGAHVVVFCDGDFWHGRDWPNLRKKLRRGSNAPYWSAKIARNIRRDASITNLLKCAGWHVIRIWEGKIRENPALVAAQVRKIVTARRRQVGGRDAPRRKL
jgi:DNA mismatch endonuclease (patch repair protein)